jgi:hypothetical protein
MRGKPLMIGLLVFTAIFAAALWWFQTRAYYHEIPAPDAILVQDQRLLVEEFRGIDAESSPLKLRACFRTREGMAPEALDIFPRAADAEPLVAPDWFDCFDAAAIAGDIASGVARPVLAARDEPEGFDRMIAVYPDGRGYMWRQLNEKFRE